MIPLSCDNLTWFRDIGWAGCVIFGLYVVLSRNFVSPDARDALAFAQISARAAQTESETLPISPIRPHVSLPAQNKNIFRRATLRQIKSLTYRLLSAPITNSIRFSTEVLGNSQI